MLYLVRSRWSSELAKALATAKRRGWILVISTISRLGRRVSFVARLMEQKDVPFACADAPDDEPFILHVKAAVAKEEAQKIIARTKAALAVAKASGKKLGTPANLTDDARRRVAEANAARARARQAIIRPEIAAARAQGFSMRAIAERVGVATAAVLPHTA